MLVYSPPPGGTGPARLVFQFKISKIDNAVGFGRIFTKLRSFVVPMWAISDRSWVDIRPQPEVLRPRVCEFWNTGILRYSPPPGGVGPTRPVFQPKISKIDNSVEIGRIITKLRSFVVPMGAISDRSLVDIRPKLYALGPRVCGF